MKAAYEIVKCEYGSGPRVGGSGSAENGAAEQHPFRCQYCFKMGKHTLSLGTAAGKTVENIVETDALKSTVHARKGIEKVMSYELGLISPESSSGPGEAAGTVIKQGKQPFFAWITGNPAAEFPAPVRQIPCSASGFKMNAADITIEVFLQIGRRTFPDIGVPYSIHSRIIKKEHRKHIWSDRPFGFFLKLNGFLDRVFFVHVSGKKG